MGIIMMDRRSESELDQAIRNYERRPAKFDEAERGRRYREFSSAHASARLSGAPELSPRIDRAMHLLADGRVSEEEYQQICVLELKEMIPTSLPKRTRRPQRA
jgi:hypothetical protein